MVQHRDLGVLALCCIAILLSTRQDGGLSFTVSWFHPIDPTATVTSTYKNGHSPDLSEKLPPPIVTDIDGDGLNEIILTTREPKLKILQMTNAALPRTGPGAAAAGAGSSSSQSAFWSEAAPSHVDENGLEQLVVRGEVSLLAHSHKMRAGRQPVALATGYLRPYSTHRARKQIIVVVTDGFELLVYNHKLKLLWHRAMDVDMRHSFLHEVAVTVNAHGMRSNDTGSVIVGARLALKRDIAKYALHKNWKKKKSKKKAAAAGTADAPAPHEHRKREFDVTDDESGSAEEEFDRQHHFSFYAYEGRSGRLRWKHEAGDFYEEAAPHTVLKPQHSTHSGELDWRHFRGDLVAHALPHGWWSRDDTRFQLTQLHRTRPGKDRHHHTQHRLKHTGAGGGGGLLNAPSTAALVAAKHKKAAATSANSVAGKVAAAGYAAFGGLLPHNPDEHVEHPNAIIAHLKDGLEVIHFYTGRTICRLSLKNGALHVDVNGDGVIDHIEAVSSMPSNSPLVHTRQNAAGQHHSRLPKCLGLVSSGIPATHQLYNGTICHVSRFQFSQTVFNPFGLSVVPSELSKRLEDAVAKGDAAASEAVNRAKSAARESAVASGVLIDDDDDRNVFVALPAVLMQVDEPHIDYLETHSDASTGHAHTYRSCFFINDGTVTCYDPNGKGAWQTTTPSKWLAHDFEDDSSALNQLRSHALHPSLTPYSLVSHDGLHDHLLVIGEDTLTVVSGSDGTQRTEYALSEISVSAPVMGDWNHDQWTDLILTSPKGYYGLALEHSIGFQFFTILVGAILGCVLLVFAVNLAGGTNADSATAGTVKVLSSKRMRGKHI